MRDIRIAVAGLSPRRRIASAEVTGFGGDAWSSDPAKGHWRADIVRVPGAPAADLYLEPTRVETGREFTIRLGFDDGTSAEFPVAGGRADPAARMPSAALSASWPGQDGSDRVGPGPNPGPDGLVDARVELRRLMPGVEVRDVSVEGPGASRWATGPNPEARNSAEFHRRRDDPTRADVYLQPASQLSGAKFRISVTYATEQVDSADVVASRHDPTLRMPSVAAPSPSGPSPAVRWLGQSGDGRVHLQIDGLPAGRSVAAAILSDSVATTWTSGTPAYREPSMRDLEFRLGSNPTRAEIVFAPSRDESTATMTLRLHLDDGAWSVTRVPGGACDPRKLDPRPDPTTVDARPGDDLSGLARRFGTIRLGAGTFRHVGPLRLPRPTRIEGVAGSILELRQEAGEAPWRAAVEIGAGGTTLAGLAVRFAGPVRWDAATPHGPAVIGVADGRPANAPGMADLRIEGLEVDTPTVDPAGWAEAPRSIRLVGASGGRVAGNTIRGGTVEFAGGPWEVVDNTYVGTPRGSFSHAVFAGHATHDVQVRRNVARQAAPGGKAWRFLVLTQTGTRDVVAENRVAGIGPRDDDPMPDPNAPEVILTEAYRLTFEGVAAATSADRRVVRLAGRQGWQAGVGGVVATVSGPHAGRWTRVAQAIDPDTYLLDDPLPDPAAAIVVTSGFVGEAFEANLVDTRGSRKACNLVLVGNHFGTRVVGNRFLGGGAACKITAAPTEEPVHWGWSHAPMLDLEVVANVFAGSTMPGEIGVEHGPKIRAGRGRLAMSLRFLDNAIVADGPPPTWTLGDPAGVDPAELRVESRGNTLRDSMTADARVAAGRPAPIRIFGEKRPH